MNLIQKYLHSMSFHRSIGLVFFGSVLSGMPMPSEAMAQEIAAAHGLSLEQVKASGRQRSIYRKPVLEAKAYESPEANVQAFRAEIEPILRESCYDCHGPETAEGDLRVDALDPDLFRGEDVSWWLEVSAAVNNGEMPPEDGPELADEDRSRIIDWLSTEIQIASQARRDEQGHSSFRRMTRYEYNYALQDLLGLELDFAKDLPPDPVSEDGFKNSSEMLQMTPKQYADYMNLNRSALNRATVRGDRPEMLYWGITAKRAATRRIKTRQELDAEIGRVAETIGEVIAEEQFEEEDEEKEEEDEEKKEVAEVRPTARPAAARGGRGGRGGQSAHYLNMETGETSAASWAFRRAVHAWTPTSVPPALPEPSEYIVVLPSGQRFVVDLGNRIPDEGILRVRLRASRVSDDDNSIPSVALEFGWQGSNNSKGSVRISQHDLEIDASPGEPQFYQWDIPLSEIYPRNPVRKTVALGAPKLTNPSEYIRLHNTSLSPTAGIQFDYIEVSAPVYEQWPPASHKRIFIGSENSDDEDVYAREIVSQFMKRAWRHSVSAAEVDRKMEYFARVRPLCEDFQQAVIEVLATVLSSPRFLYLVQSDRSTADSDRTLDPFELATRLSMFLWCSTPDDELLDLAAQGRLGDKDELVRQTHRMLADPRHERFSEHFVRQWLNMELLDYLTVDRSTYPQFDGTLKDAMQQEPIAFFEEMLQNDRSVLDFLHADYAMVNERLARHYGISDVSGIHFQKVSLNLAEDRGGLLTMAGLLAMNSDGKDSHPLKRSIWLLESVLNDPPPPPPPSVPEIDLADPEILKLTIKERMEDHRNQAACMSCHVKIDPWGIALENFDAVGRWRDQIKGEAIDASSDLFNQHTLDGIEGLKRYLLANRQDQFARAIVHKMTTFALGRPLTFSDRASVDGLTAELRKKEDGLASLVALIVASDLFQSR
ncbi:Planctomycete cytochrome C [Novipirellula aureliae]|uniref:Planctomycete cytochrome C n=1 Tax=Novipirellula aureliae TaxID=2527966 RepID=A0A5C6E929_9BACT|nr:DUF1592 domain-containing protein [Novipirellula aureliae]TWU45310.1 Planctomycete cytochrome C [Novipirellula aureliae]